MKASVYVSQANFTATVHAADGVRFAASSRSPEQLTAQIVSYIRERCDDVLWPAVAKQVRRLIDERQSYAAIVLYFAEVGQRWDEERLELEGISFGALGESGGPLAVVG
jgi:hypothetical protein